MDVLRRYRSLNLPETIPVQAYRTAGVPEGMVGRTVAALKFLGLLNDADEPTDEWRALCAVEESSFPAQLEHSVRAAYADIFKVIDPRTDTWERVKSAFQPYSPKSQIDQMVTLFLRLCAEAGIATLETPKVRRTKAQQQNGGTRPLRQARPVTATPSSVSTLPANGHTPESPDAPDYSPVAAVVRRLPSSGKWTPDQRDRWLAAITATVDLVVEAVEA